MAENEQAQATEDDPSFSTTGGSISDSSFLALFRRAQQRMQDSMSDQPVSTNLLFPNDGEPITQEEITQELNTLVGAGHETTSNTLVTNSCAVVVEISPHASFLLSVLGFAFAEQAPRLSLEAPTGGRRH